MPFPPQSCRLGVLLALLIAAPAVAQNFPGATLAEVVPEGREAFDFYGRGISHDGDRVVIGAPGDDDADNWAGAAYVFEHDPEAGWVEAAKLVAEDAGSRDEFGGSISLEGDRVLIGAVEDDDSGQNAGAAYVFERDPTTGVWSQQAKLVPVSAAGGDRVGGAVVLDGDLALVSEHLFARDPDTGTWSELPSLRPGGPLPPNYGNAVDLDGDHAAVCGGGSPFLTYLFERNPATGQWALDISFRPEDSNGGCKGVSLDGDRLLVGGYVSLEVGSLAGYTFVRDPQTGVWSEEGKLVALDLTSGSGFGDTVSLDGDYALIGAPRYGTFGTVESWKGRSFLFRWTEAGWLLLTNRYPNFVNTGTLFSESISFSGGRLFFGGSGRQCSAGQECGVAYTFDLDDITLQTYVRGPRGFRYLGSPSQDFTVDDLAEQNIVRGMPGYYPSVVSANLYTQYVADPASWVESSGAGEVLRPGHAFRWYQYDEAFGDPEISDSVELPFFLGTNRTLNMDEVTVELQTGGSRFNYLANPYWVRIDPSGILDWPGGENLSPFFGVEVFDQIALSWVDPAERSSEFIEPWEAFRVRAKGPRVNGRPRTLTIPLSATPVYVPSNEAASVLRSAVQARAEVDRDDVVLSVPTPNPSVDRATVSFTVPAGGQARVSVFDVQGREVAVLVDGVIEAGRHDAVFHTTRLAAGVYVIRLQTSGEVVTQRMVVVS